MSNIINPPTRMCPKCKCKFEFTGIDIREKSEQYWTGFFNGDGLDGGWKFRTIRYLECPGCKHRIEL